MRIKRLPDFMNGIIIKSFLKKQMKMYFKDNINIFLCKIINILNLNNI